MGHHPRSSQSFLVWHSQSAEPASYQGLCQYKGKCERHEKDAVALTPSLFGEAAKRTVVHSLCERTMPEVRS